MATLDTALTRLLGIQHPILLAPMGSAAGGKLAAAVTHAGGLGMLGSGYADEKAIRRELVEAGNARVGIGFITVGAGQEPGRARCRAGGQAGGGHAVVRRSVALYGPHQAGGQPIICQVQTLEQAKQAAAAGADVIIAQGRDAGGHSGMTARHDRTRAGGRRCRRVDPGCRRRRHCRRARPCRRLVAGRRQACRWARASPPRANRCGTRR